MTFGALGGTSPSLAVLNPPLDSESARLVSRLLSETRIAEKMVGWSSASCELVGGGRNARHVLHVRPVNKAISPGFAIKLVGAGHGLDEIANFEKSVRHAIPATMRPDLLAYVQEGNQVAICFEWWTGPAGGPASTLTSKLQSGDDDAIPLVLRDGLPALCTAWYEKGHVCTDASIADRYLGRFFADRYSRLEAEDILKREAEIAFGARCTRQGLRLGSQTFPLPSALFDVSSREYGYRQSTIHGDFNSDNLLLSSGRLGLVDFRHTGPGHIFEDIVSLEASVRINSPAGVGAQDILGDEGLIALGRPVPIPSYASAVADIRKFARQRLGALEPWRHYHFAAAAIGLRLMHAVDLTATARARIVASVLWSTRIWTVGGAGL